MYSCVVDTLDRGILVWVGFLVVGGGGVCLGCWAGGGGNWKGGERRLFLWLMGLGLN